VFTTVFRCPLKWLENQAMALQFTKFEEVMTILLTEIGNIAL